MDPSTPHPQSLPKTRRAIEALVQSLRAEHAAAPDKTVFYDTHRTLFNCYAYASGGVGNPFVMNAYDTPTLTMAIPGARAGKPMRFVDGDELDRAIIADGYTPAIPKDAQRTLSADALLRMQATIAKEIRPDQVLIAALIDDSGLRREPHFMLRDQQGRWSQKFGAAAVLHSDYPDGPLTPPHLGHNKIQQRYPQDEHSYRFVGYYWRPAAGLAVQAGIAPAIGIPSPAGGYRTDIWRNGNESHVEVAKEVRGWSVKKHPDGSVTLGLEHDNQQRTFLTLDAASIPMLDKRVYGENIGYIAVVDPSGPALQLQLLPDGRVKASTAEYPTAKRPSPFRP
jgi:hypothetical protein